MSGNIYNLTAIRALAEELKKQPIVNEHDLLKLDSMAGFVMPVQNQLDQYKHICLVHFSELVDRLEHSYLTLVNLAHDIFNQVHLPPKFITHTSCLTQKDYNEETGQHYVTHGLTIICGQLTAIEKHSSPDANDFRAHPDWPQFSVLVQTTPAVPLLRKKHRHTEGEFLHDCAVAPQLNAMIRNVEQLAKNNNGINFITAEDGDCVAFIPHTSKNNIIIKIHAYQPFTAKQAS